MKSLTTVKIDHDLIIKTLIELKKCFWHCLIFSAVINLLSLALPLYSMQVLDRVLGSSSIETLIYLSIIVLIAVVIMNAMNSVRDAAFSYIAKSFEKKLSAIAFKRNLQDCFKINIGPQYIKDLSAIKSFITGPHLVMIFDVPWVLIFLGVIFYIHWIQGLVITISAITLAFMAFLNSKLLKSDSEKLNELQVIQGRRLEVLTRNSEIAVVMGMMENINKKYLHWQDESKEIENRLKKRTKAISVIVKNLRYIVQMALTFISAILIIKGKMSSGGMIAISILSSKVLAPFDASSAIFGSMVMVKKSYQRLKNVVVPDKSDDKIQLPIPRGAITFENVIFVPQGMGTPIINNISFKTTPGEVIGIIGKSGSGKTTLARLISGVFEPTRGRVMIDSAPLHLWNKDHLGKFIGYLPQDIELFQASIKENIARMNVDAKDEDIIKAAMLAGVHELILSLPQGYETEIGQTNISAGQRQRIALARCFYGTPKVIILDEPNSNLDLEGEDFLAQSVINAKNAKITVFIISHKPSILKVTDRIMVINNGELKAFEDRDKIVQTFGAGNEK